MSNLLELENDSVTLLSKIIKYENEIFNKFIHNRTKLLKNIKSLNYDNLDKESLLNFINNLKSIIDPIKASNDAMDAYFINKNNFKIENKNDFNENDFILFYFFFKDFFIG